MIEQWSKHRIFAGIEESELQCLRPAVKKIPLTDKQSLMCENDRDYKNLSQFFIVHSGQIRIFHKDSNTDIACVGSGALIGLTSVLDGNPRTSSAESIGEAEVYQFDYSLMENQLSDSAFFRLMQNMQKCIHQKIRDSNTASVASYQQMIDHQQKINSFGIFFSLVITVIIAYMFILRILVNHTSLPLDVDLVGYLLMLAFSLLFLILINKGTHTLAEHGITKKNIRLALKEGLVLAGASIIFITGLKYYIITYYPQLFGPQLFTPNLAGMIILTYLPFIIIEEFMMRGIVQSTLHHFFTGRFAYTKTIILTTAVFIATQLHHGVSYGLLLAIPSVILSMLYARHRNLVDVVSCHLIVGFYTVLVLGFPINEHLR